MKNVGIRLAGLFLTVITLMFTGCGDDSSSPAVLSISTASLPAGTAGTVYGPVTLSATNGKLPLTWSNPTGTLLAAGLALSPAGVISGTPTAAGTISADIKVTDSATPAVTATKVFSITVNPAALIITTTSPLAAGTLGAVYGPVPLLATGGTGSYTWSNPAGTLLAAGLTLNTVTGVITGTPTAAGTITASITVTDSATPAKTATTIFSITVGAVAGPLTGFTPLTLPDATVGTLYTQALVPTGGTAPFTWSDAATLPAFLTLNTATGVITGTPANTDVGPFSFDITVTDSAATPVTIGPLTFTNNVNFDSPTALLFFNDTLVPGIGCVACHVAGGSAGVITGGRTAAQITTAINGVGAMTSLYDTAGFFLTVPDIAALAAITP